MKIPYPFWKFLGSFNKTAKRYEGNPGCEIKLHESAILLTHCVYLIIIGSSEEIKYKCTSWGYKRKQKNSVLQRSKIMSLNLANMSTETRNPNTMLLDTMTPLEIVTAMNQEDARIAQVIQPELPHVAQCVVWGIASIQSGGRIIYMGAGTSGRLGVLDAVECPPTFGVDPSLVVGLIAGGEKAFVRAVEGAEDDPNLGRLDLQKIHLVKEDLVIGIAASGRTPYVLGGLEYAREVGCHTVAISCNPGSVIGKYAQLAIEVVPGPEVLTGSTRLKAGTCQKLILNMISTATMVGCGKAYQNLMVDVVQTNEKLVTRAQNIVMEATGVNRETAKKMISEAGGSCKKAIVMILANCDAEAARKRLDQAKGHVREAIRE